MSPHAFGQRLIGSSALIRNRSRHLVAAKSANSSRSSRRSISLLRFCGSLSVRKARASSGVGGMPITSKNTRRRNTSSAATSEGGKPSAFRLAKTSSSILLLASTAGKGVASGCGTRRRTTPDCRK